MQILSPEAIERLDDEARSRYLTDLAHALSLRVKACPDFAAEARAIVAECRASGHELQSFDEDDDWQVWCGEPAGPSRLVISLVHSTGAEAAWRWE
jgi:hypothetical protein